MSDNGQRVPLPGCMIGPSEPCDAFQRQTARIAELEAEIYDLRATLNRLPPYDADGFYIDHGEHGPEPVSVADVMDSLYGTILALDAARAKEQK